MKKQRFFEIVRFGTSGVIVLSAYYITLYGLTEFMKVKYYLSATVGSVLSYTISFLFQKYWTFKNKDIKTIPRQAILYICMALGLLFLNSTFLYLLVQYSRLEYLIAQIIITVVLSVVSYLVTKRIFAR